MTDVKDASLKKLIMLLYGLNVVFVLFQFTLETGFLGLIAILVAITISYQKKTAAAGTIYESRLRHRV